VTSIRLESILIPVKALVLLQGTGATTTAAGLPCFSLEVLPKCSVASSSPVARNVECNEQTPRVGFEQGDRGLWRPIAALPSGHSELVQAQIMGPARCGRTCMVWEQKESPVFSHRYTPAVRPLSRCVMLEARGGGA
jgi:hypothetical protein